MQYKKRTLVAVPLMMAISVISLMGGVTDDEKRFYVTPLQTNAFKFDTVDLVSGIMREHSMDFGMGNVMPLTRTYSSGLKHKGLPFGNFTHNFTKALNAHKEYEEESIASKLQKTPQEACEKGWEEIAPFVYLGKLEDLNAVYDEKRALCQVFDDANELKTTLVLKDAQQKTVAHSNAFKLLSRPDGTEVLFYKDINNLWHNTTNEPLKLKEVLDGYELVLENGDRERYDQEGILQQIVKNTNTYTLGYDIEGTLVQVQDNLAHKMTFSYGSAHEKIQSITYFDGTMIQYKYKEGKLQQVIYPDARVESYQYEDDRLIQISKDNTVQKTYRYDSSGKVEEFAGINGSQLKTITYDKDGIDVEENMLLTSYTFIVTHSQAKLLTVEDEEGKRSYAYDNHGHPTHFTDNLGRTRLTQYDSDGLLVKEVENAGTNKALKIEREYDPETHKVLKIIEPDHIEYNVYSGDRLSYHVNTLLSNGVVVENDIKHYAYSDQGLLDKTEHNGKVEAVAEFDTHGNVLKVKNHLGLVEKATQYNRADLPIRTVDSDGVVTEKHYDVMGRSTRVIKDGKTSTMKYDTEGRLAEHTSMEGVISHFKYDTMGNIAETSDSRGEHMVYQYDSDNNLIDTQHYYKGTLVSQEHKTYDKRHHLLSKTDAYGYTTTYTYNVQGQKTAMTDAKGRTTRYVYNQQGKLVKEINAEGGETRYEHDAKGHKTKIVTPNGATFTYTYDGFDRLVSESNPDRGVTTYTYDASGKILTRTNANGDVVKYVYDTLGRKIDELYSDARLNMHYTYNYKSELVGRSDASSSIEVSYDKENISSKTQTIDNLTFKTAFTYTNTDKIATYTYPSGKTLSYTYSADNQIQSMAVDGMILIDNIKMINRQLQGYSYADGTLHHRVYDLKKRLVKLDYPEYSENISYDAVDNMVSVNQEKYMYDLVDRVTNVNTNSTLLQEFVYDKNGNRVAMTDAKGRNSTYMYAPKSNILESINHRLTGLFQGASLYSYDASGNIVDDGVHSYSYDARNRLVDVDGNVSYVYNADNQRISKTVNGVTTYYIYDGHKLLGEYDQDGQMIKEYIYLHNTPVAFVTPTQRYYIYADHLDTPRKVVDTNHAVVWSWKSKVFGESLPTGSITLNLRFPGQYYDAETGHHYNINRDYNPVTGRYIQSDPVGFKGGVNTYAYAEGNPVMKKDEMGLWTSGKYYFPKVHQSVNARLWGRYRWFVGILNRGTVSIDRHQAGHESYLHAMRGRKWSNGPLDTYSEARVRSENFVINGMWMARYYHNVGNASKSLADFAWVLHTMQDSSSPSHRYFQLWTGHESYWTIWKHVRKEMHTPSSMNHAVYRASRWIYAMYYYRLIPRHGAIFNYFN